MLSLASTLLGVFCATYSYDPFDADVALSGTADALVWGTIGMEFAFLLDIFVSCLVEYRDLDNRVVRKASKIAWQYV